DRRGRRRPPAHRLGRGVGPRLHDRPGRGGAHRLPRAVSLEVLTFGCRLNAVESEAMRARAEADGLSNAVLVNTCAVTAEAVRQARQAIRRARRERPDVPILVTGCAAQTEPGT